MEFRGIEDALDKWVIIRFLDLPEDLESHYTGLADVVGKWLQYKLKGVDPYGIWLENPYWDIAPSDSPSVSQERKDALKGNALVLVKWQYIGTIIYVGGKKVVQVPLGFQAFRPPTTPPPDAADSEA